VALTNVLVVTVGLSLTIPCALVGSLFVPSAAVSAITFTSLVGAVLVCLGFTMLGSEGWKKSQEPDGGVVRAEGRDVEAAQ
jgi:solute carrier family 35 protein F5